MSTRILAGIALAGTLAACSGSSSGEDIAGYRHAVEARTGTIDETAFSHLVTATRRICNLDDRAFKLAYSIAQDQGRAELSRMGVKYMCPDRLDELG